MEASMRVSSRLALGLLGALLACAERPAPLTPPSEPEIWRTYAAMRLDDEPLPFVWSIIGTDTTRLVEQVLELRVDGTTAWRSKYLGSWTRDTLRSATYATHAILGDSLLLGSMHIALSDTVLVVEERLGRGQRWYYRRLGGRAAP